MWPSTHELGSGLVLGLVWPESSCTRSSESPPLVRTSSCFGFAPRTELSTLDVVPEYGLHLHLHSELRDGTRSESGDDFYFARLPRWTCRHVERLSPSAGVTGVLPTEIFNQAARPAAYMIAGSMMWINLFITGMVFPFLVVSQFKYFPIN